MNKKIAIVSQKMSVITANIYEYTEKAWVNFLYWLQWREY